MNFWDRVNNLLDEKGITKKELAEKVKIDPSTISKGSKENRMPAADKAVFIAQFLGTTVEYLVTGKNSVRQEINDLYKHATIIKKLDSIPQEIRPSIELMISDLSDKYSSSK